MGRPLKDRELPVYWQLTWQYSNRAETGSMLSDFPPGGSK